MTPTTSTNATMPSSAATAERPNPMLIAPNTWLVREYVDMGPVGLYANSMVILGEEPVIVDVGRAENDHWDEDVFSLVKPEAVRWIFVSRLNRSSRERLCDLASVCPNATFVTSSSLAERLRAVGNLPASRIRAIEAGEELYAGDRGLSAVRLPVSYQRDTLGLLDKTTGVLWSADSFGAAMLQPAERVSELYVGEWREGFQLFHKLTAPWLPSVSEAGFHVEVHELNGLDVRIIAGAHTPPIGGFDVGSAVDMLYDLTIARCSSFPGQTHLEALLGHLNGSESDLPSSAFVRAAA